MEKCMSKHSGNKNEKVHKLTEEEYAAYIMSLKDQTPPPAYGKYEKEEIGRPSGGKKEE